MAIAAVAGLSMEMVAAATAVSAAGAAYMGMAQSAAYKYQSGIAEMNAKVDQQNAAYEVGLGEIQAQQSGMKTAQRMGQTKATFGASGLDVHGGSATLVQASEAELGAMDQQTIRGDAMKRAYGYEVKSLNDAAQAQADRMAASNSMIAGGIGAATSILGGVGSFSSKWLQANSMGITPDWSLGLGGD